MDTKIKYWVKYSISSGCSRYVGQIFNFLEVAVYMISGSSYSFCEVALDTKIIHGSSIQFLEIALDL